MLPIATKLKSFHDPVRPVRASVQCMPVQCSACQYSAVQCMPAVDDAMCNYKMGGAKKLGLYQVFQYDCMIALSMTSAKAAPALANLLDQQSQHRHEAIALPLLRMRTQGNNTGVCHHNIKHASCQCRTALNTYLGRTSTS